MSYETQNISQLTQATEINNNDAIIIQRGNTTLQATAQELADHVNNEILDGVAQREAEFNTFVDGKTTKVTNDANAIADYKTNAQTDSESVATNKEATDTIVTAMQGQQTSITTMQDTLSSAITSANGLIEDVSEALTLANAATSSATTATTSANEATSNAVTATNNANQATSSANTATENANTAISSVNEVVSSASTATTNANQATTRANNAAEACEDIVSGTGLVASSEKGSANGVAELDSNGLVPTSQLPSYVDDVLEYNSLSLFPISGEAGKIYVATDTNKTYRWSGSSYVVISETIAIGETSSTAYRGDRGKTAYEHSNVTGNPHGTTANDLGISVPIEIIGTLTAGSTSVTLSNANITKTSTLDIYTDVYGVNPTDVTVASGSVTLTFKAQENDISVKVVV